MLKQRKVLSCMAAIALAIPATAIAGENKDHEARGIAPAEVELEEEQDFQQQDAQLQREASAQKEGDQRQQEGAQQGGQQSANQELYSLSYSEVRNLQRELQNRGLYEGNIDGIVGPQTRAALQQFQQQNQLGPNTGISQTMSALGIDESEQQNVSGNDQDSDSQWNRQGERQNVSGSDSQSGIHGQVQNTSGQDASTQLSALDQEQVRDLQMQLQQKGHYQGQVDGVVGPQTRAALQRFFNGQARMAAQGQLDDSALQLFGIEASEIQRTSGSEATTPARSQGDAATQKNRQQGSQKDQARPQKGQQQNRDQPPDGSERSPSGNSGVDVDVNMDQQRR